MASHQAPLPQVVREAARAAVSEFFWPVRTCIAICLHVVDVAVQLPAYMHSTAQLLWATIEIFAPINSVGLVLGVWLTFSFMLESSFSVEWFYSGLATCLYLATAMIHRNDSRR